jgi:arsenite methyltransferase
LRSTERIGLLAIAAGTLLEAAAQGVRRAHEPKFFLDLSSSFWSGVLIAIGIVSMLYGLVLALGLSGPAKSDGDDQTPDYGLDAPAAVRNMLIVAALGVIALVTRLLGAWSGEDAIAVVARPLMVAGLGFGAMALWMIYDSRIGKVRERETYLDKIDWNGSERVLDVGCGLGLFLIGAAKRLSTGRAVGIDKWQQEDLSGNNAAGTLRNAAIEGVADKVEVHPGDARQLPFPDASFDVVLSSMALHNIYDPGERQTAVREIARVLAPGGRVLIVDVRHTSAYAATLRDAGLTSARSVQGVFSYLLALVTFGSVGWGYVIGSSDRS